MGALGCLHVDAIEQGFELALIDREMGRARRERVGAGPAERALVQSLVEDAHPGAVAEQDLDRVAAPASEYEQRPRARRPSDPLAYNPGQSVEAPAQIDRFHAEEDLHAVWDHRRLPGASKSRTARSVAASKPAGMWILAVLNSITNAPGTDGGLGDGDRVSTRTSCIGCGADLAPAFFRRYAQWRNPPAVKPPRVSAYSLADCPLARQPATRSAQRASVVACSMPPSLPTGTYPRKTGSAQRIHPCALREAAGV